MGVNEKMTAIADAIREKTGGTDLLTLDGMAEAIAGIQAGGGDISQSGYTKICVGTITPEQDTKSVYLYHNLETVPSLVVLYLNNDPESVSLYKAHTGYKAAFAYRQLITDTDGTNYTIVSARGENGASDALEIGYPNYNSLETGDMTKYIKKGVCQASNDAWRFYLVNGAGWDHVLVAGARYNWIAFA